MIKALPLGQVLALSSRVTTIQAEPLHLPMLDFHCLRSAQNDELVKTVIKQIGLGGYIAASGRSNHFYGRALVDEQALVDFLGMSLSPVTDRASIADQLLERACGLRISPGKGYPDCPKIIYEV
jgi:hypothetical protein